MSTPDSIQSFDAERAATYDNNIRAVAPGYEVLHEAIAAMMDASLTPTAHMLVVGAGTGREIVEMGRAHPEWRFTAVDPSPAMLDQCRATLVGTDLADRVEYVCERVEDLSGGSRFDGATAIFVSHFLQEMDAKRRFFEAIRDHLAPQAPFGIADLYADDTERGDRRRAWRAWVARKCGREEMERRFSRIERDISFLQENRLQALLHCAGFASLTRLYQCFQWGAWVTRAA
jgi:tRNA (cmo5U34)-methyltransferase